MQPAVSDTLMGPKMLNYQFLCLVRDQKFPQAFKLGTKILEDTPDNPAVRKFIQFMAAHDTELTKMAEEHAEEAEYESVGSDEEEESEKESGESEDKSEKSQEEEESEPEKQEKEEKGETKIELSTCTLNSIPHICPRHHKQLGKTES